MGTKENRAGAGVFSVEQPLWRAVTAFRLLTLLYAVGRYAGDAAHYAHPAAAWAYMGVLSLWTFATVRQFASKARCTWWWLYADLALVVAGILLTRSFDQIAQVDAGEVTLPTVRAAATVLGFSVLGGWRPAALAALIVGLANIGERGRVTSSNVHNIVLLMLAGIAIGYVVELARASEQTLARALEIQAATRERERLARDIHDGVLQVLAMVQRRGTELGGEAEEIGRMAGEQEIALRALIAEGLAPNPSYEAPRRQSDHPDPGAPQDLRALLGPLAGSRVTVAAPGTPVLLPGRAASELSAAVGAALDNVRKHAGPGAQTWILVEDEPDAVVVSVRDDGPGFAASRLGEAEQEGRLGVSQSIRGRLRDLGGSAEITSAAGQGTEVELRVPRQRGKASGASATAAAATKESTT
ncbi:MacS family sensor histidine kinase [Streptacidiphilus sp. N1-12]|uniref:MacS family sensor histidine kinase n=2 Tax=Streptacidiphilus alkalitolerans TaxID=3342712 RepID=A0ABV6VFE1_9ACTN